MVIAPSTSRDGHEKATWALDEEAERPSYDNGYVSVTACAHLGGVGVSCILLPNVQALDTAENMTDWGSSSQCDDG
jgi:hypothetical protein